MLSPSRVIRQLLDRRLPLRTRLGLVAAGARRRIRPRAWYAVRYGRGDLLLSHDDFAIDRRTLAFVLLDRAYRTDYRDALVLDVGAHKGYFAAYALGEGARAVVSFEPERANAELLGRSAASYRARGADWQVRPVALGARSGEAELHVMDASWGHALDPPAEFAEYEVGSQLVRVEALGPVLAEAGALADGARVVVKVNVEGEECPMLLETALEAWAPVSELLVETHPWASCGADDLAAHLAPAGLTRAESGHPLVLRLRRAGAARSDRRSGSS
jgi:FkbM family methyltransferase